MLLNAYSMYKLCSTGTASNNCSILDTFLFARQNRNTVPHPMSREICSNVISLHILPFGFPPTCVGKQGTFCNDVQKTFRDPGKFFPFGVIVDDGATVSSDDLARFSIDQNESGNTGHLELTRQCLLAK